MQSICGDIESLYINSKCEGKVVGKLLQFLYDTFKLDIVKRQFRFIFFFFGGDIDKIV